MTLTENSSVVDPNVRYLLLQSVVGYFTGLRLLQVITSKTPIYKNLKLYGLFLWMGFNCHKATESLWGGILLFTTRFPEIPGTHLIDLGRMKRLSRPRSHPVVLITVPLDWESSTLTTMPLWNANSQNFAICFSLT